MANNWLPFMLSTLCVFESLFPTSSLLQPVNQSIGWRQGVDFSELFPLELMLEIFCFFTPQQLASIRTVSKRWRDAASDPSLYRSLHWCVLFGGRCLCYLLKTVVSCCCRCRVAVACIAGPLFPFTQHFADHCIHTYQRRYKGDFDPVGASVVWYDAFVMDSPATMRESIHRLSVSRSRVGTLDKLFTVDRLSDLMRAVPSVHHLDISASYVLDVHLPVFPDRLTHLSLAAFHMPRPMIDYAPLGRLVNLEALSLEGTLRAHESLLVDAWPLLTRLSLCNSADLELDALLTSLIASPCGDKLEGTLGSLGANDALSCGSEGGRSHILERGFILRSPRFR